MAATNLTTEYRHMRTGSLNIQPPAARANGIMSPMHGNARFDAARSPPNTSHVPCKFFRQGTCQAGNTCPFSHDLSAAAENVCKYFAKGNCKFGPKCANIHVLPDGRRINYGKNGVTIGAPPSAVALGTRVNPTTYHQPSNSALTNSFLRADAVPPYNTANPFGAAAPQDDRYTRGENALPIIDTTYTSNPTSTYGSPRDDDQSRFGLGLSPVAKGLSVLDAPLPASFDSNGISHAARYGPWPSSVPAKFGLESPSPSLNAAKDARTSDTLKLLHSQAFGPGSGDHLSPSALAPSSVGGLDANVFGSSPLVGSAALGGEEYFGKRLHSATMRYAKPRLISSSAPKIDRDWESEFLFEEDYVPGALANEVLTPAEKARRGSATNTLRPIDLLESTTESAPISTKFGSPITAASPSRWGPLFQRQKEEEALAELGAGGSSFTREARSALKTSAFGHVGSPLRNSSLASAITAELNGSSRDKSAGGGDSYLALAQQLERTRLADGAGSSESSPRLQPQIPRGSLGGNGSAGLGSNLGSIGSGPRERGMAERHSSAQSIGSSSVTGRFTTSIEEEDPAFVFSMEEEEVSQPPAHTLPQAAPPLGTTTWSYAAAAATSGNGRGAGASSGASQRAGGAVETIAGR